MYFSLIFSFIFIVPVLVITWNLRKNISPYKTIFESIVIIAVLVIAVLLFAGSNGQSLGEQFMNMVKSIAEVLAGTEEFVTTAGIGELTYEERVTLIVSVYGMISSLLPSTVLIASTVMTYFLYMLMSKIYKKIGGHPAELIPLKYFRWPPNLMLGFLIIFLLSWLVGNAPIFAGTQICTNVNLIFEFVVAVQGLAVVFLLFDAKKLPKIGAVVVGALGMLTGIGRMILFAVGAVDYILNLRARVTRR